MNPAKKIGWVVGPDGKPGFTWNPLVGCSKGCPYCYARRQAKRRKHECEECYRFVPHLHAERLGQPAARQKPTGIFVCSMGELFDPKVCGSADTYMVLNAMCEAPQHRYYLLTKRPDVAAAVLSEDYAHSAWARWRIGTSASTQAEFDERVPQLRRLRKHDDRPVLFVSIEPLLGPVDLSKAICRHDDFMGGCHSPCDPCSDFPTCSYRGINWVIVGGQTGPSAVKPKPEWIAQIREQCTAAGVPLFEKDNLDLIEPRREFPSS